MSDDGEENEMEDVGATPSDFFDHEPSKHEKIEVRNMEQKRRRNLAFMTIKTPSLQRIVDSGTRVLLLRSYLLTYNPVLFVRQSTYALITQPAPRESRTTSRRMSYEFLHT